uniref:Reverse transcriptase domain-containing protein n=1 Tax=Schistocephalus solidus TaxID=70667 RepID=A0A0X3P598_SCHSO
MKSYDTDIPASVLLELIDLCLETTFPFDHKYYKQLKGALAKVTIQTLESLALPLVNPKLWERYVDDTFVVVREEDQLETLHNTITSTISGIKFTLANEVDDKLQLLDVFVQRKTNGTLHTPVFRKETYVEVILHYKSNNPISHKGSTVSSLLHRAKTLL